MVWGCMLNASNANRYPGFKIAYAQSRLQQHSSSKTPTGLLKSQIFTVLLKKRGCYNVINMALSHLLWNWGCILPALCCPGIHFKFTFISFLKWYIKHLVCFLFPLWIKLWVYEICKSLKSVLMSILHSVPTVLKLGFILWAIFPHLHSDTVGREGKLIRVYWPLTVVTEIDFSWWQRWIFYFYPCSCDSYNILEFQFFCPDDFVIWDQQY